MVLGIINATPDSFYARGCVREAEQAIARGLEMAADGARMLDIGGESTRPGASAVSETEELARILPVIRGLRERLPEVLLSVDTRHTAVARAALEAGADVINDVSALHPDAGMWELIAETGAGYIVVHSRGTPQTMETLTAYPEGVVTEVKAALLDATERLRACGVKPEQIILDAGFGFAKSPADSLKLLGATAEFAALPYPYLVAASRKRFVGEVTGQAAPEDREAGSLAAALWAIQEGATLVRTHDVRATIDAIRMFLAAKETRNV